LPKEMLFGSRNNLVLEYVILTMNIKYSIIKWKLNCKL